MQHDQAIKLGRTDTLFRPRQHSPGLIESSDPPTCLRQGRYDSASSAPQLQDRVANHVGELTIEFDILTKRVVLQIVERDNIRVWIVINV